VFDGHGWKDDMKRVAVLLLLSSIVLPGCTARHTKAEPPRALTPGDYRLSLTATEGSRVGGVVEGVATLRLASPTDVSPRTGEPAKDSHEPLLYGWTAANLAGVGAPLCAEHPHPLPDSQDPLRPGLLVVRVPYGPGGPFTGKQEVSAVLVATLTNLRTGERWLDGCGFAMYILNWDGQCHAGEWREWGLRKDGRERFRLCQK
jgi:hypothetical protein